MLIILSWFIIQHYQYLSIHLFLKKNQFPIKLKDTLTIFVLLIQDIEYNFFCYFRYKRFK